MPLRTPHIAVACLLSGCSLFGGGRRGDAVVDTADPGGDTGIVIDVDDDDGGAEPEPPVVPLSLGADVGPVLDPERGWMDWIDLLDPGADYGAVRTQGRTLAYAGVGLAAARDGMVDADRLAAIDAGLDRVRAAGIKVVLRFHYTDGDDLADAPLEVILGHIQQLAPLLEDHADVIYVLQAGFIGAWGEWHGSTAGNDTAEARALVLGELLDALPDDRMVQVRTPMFKAEALGGPLSAVDAFDGGPAARVGHHNDCLLASDTDMGTYAADDVDGWRAFVAAESAFVPHGGETCGVYAPRTDCDAALDELALLGTRYLNALYHPDVLAGWAAGGCDGEIGARLGHHLVLAEAALSESVAPGGLARLELTLENTGWGALVNPRPLLLVISGSPEEVRLPLDEVDLRRLGPGERARIVVGVRVPVDTEPGARALSLWMPDPAPSLREDPRYALRLGNEGAFDTDTGRNRLGALIVDADAIGDTRPTADAWVREEVW
jgi:hypothetical protein